MKKVKFKMTDAEITKRRKGGESIQTLAEKNEVSFTAMRRKLMDLGASPEEVNLFDTLSDGDGNFYSVINITPNGIIAKNRETKAIVEINKKDFLYGDTIYHRLPTAPVKVYNLNDIQKEEKMPREELKTPETTGEIRPYLRKIDEILNVAEGIGTSAEQYLYDLVSEIFRNGFDEEFEGGKDD